MKYSYFGRKTEIHLNNNWIYDEDNPDIVFSFGGDGTMLKAINKYCFRLDKILFVGVKKGNLGFFYGFGEKSLEEIVTLIEANDYQTNNYQLIEFIINNKIYTALNEIAITNPIHTQVIDVYINDLFFEKFRGTGFIVSPPAGSTAYNKSLGGSIVDPNLKAFQLVEIASINNRLYKTISSPLIFGSTYQLKLVFEDSQNVFLSIDGEEVKIKDFKEIKINLSENHAQIISSKEDFFEKVRKAFI